MSFRNCKLDFGSLATGWAPLDPAYENWEPDPDTVPLPGNRKDPRFARENGPRSNVNKVSYSPMPTQNTHPVAGIDSKDTVTSSVDLSKGWPETVVREHGPPRAFGPSRAFGHPRASPSQASAEEYIHRSASSTPSTGFIAGSASPGSLASWSPSQVELLKEEIMDEKFSATDAQAFDRFRAAKNVILWEESTQSSPQITILELMNMDDTDFQEMHDKAKSKYEKLKEQQDKRDFLEWRANHHLAKQSNAAIKTTLNNGHMAYDNMKTYGSDEEDGCGDVVFRGRTGRAGWN